MLRLIRRMAGIGLLAATAVVVGGGYMALDPIAGRLVERGGTRATGVPTEVAAVNVRPLAGELALRDLRVANPEGFRQPHFFTLADAVATVRMRSLMNERIELPRVALRGLRLELERDEAGRGNHEPIVEHLRRVTRDDEAARTGRRYLVEELILSDITIVMEVALPLGLRQPITVALDDIRLTDVGGGGAAGDGQGVLMSQLGDIVVRTVIEAVAGEAARTLPGALLKRLRQEVERPLSAPEPGD